MEGSVDGWWRWLLSHIAYLIPLRCTRCCVYFTTINKERGGGGEQEEEEDGEGRGEGGEKRKSLGLGVSPLLSWILVWLQSLSFSFPVKFFLFDVKEDATIPNIRKNETKMSKSQQKVFVLVSFGLAYTTAFLPELPFLLKMTSEEQSGQFFQIRW